MNSKVDSKKERKSGNIFSALLGILGTLIIIAVIVCMIPLAVPKIMGYQTYDVVSGSMESEIPVGSLVLVKDTEPSDIAQGDVIAFYSASGGDAVVTHRVVENDAERGEFITKGDANEQNDMNPVPYSNLLGRVEKHYPVIGGIMAGLTTGMGKIYLLMILAAGVILNFLSGKLKE